MLKAINDECACCGLHVGFENLSELFYAHKGYTGPICPLCAGVISYGMETAGKNPFTGSIAAYLWEIVWGKHGKEWNSLTIDFSKVWKK